MGPVPSGDPDPGYRARSYQLEMFEASLKNNIVVAMGTGSGKTHIALLRIMHELENGDGKKLIWFLAPTVALCLQQHRAISQHIPAAKSRTLTGLDKVELWTEQVVWDTVLSDMQVVVSTPAVLLDAMTHGFVRISRLGLIIFDEAHHCTQNHPANRVMRYFYHPTLAKSGPNAVPRILGLTASAGSNRDELRTIEENLHSVCTTPQAHRHELLEHTHKPQLQRVLYTPLAIEGASLWGGTEKALVEAYQMLDIENDPYVKRLRASEPHGIALQRVLMTGNTYCSEQLKKFVRRVAHISAELGPWAADYFIWESTQQLRGSAVYTSLTMDMDDDERKYLVDILSKLSVPKLNIHSTNPADFPVSPKCEALISFLLNTDEPEFSGLIFVQQRATVAVMAHLLSVHPFTRDRFRTGGFIGMSNSTKKKEMLGDLLTVKMQRDTLDDFRHGRKNLIVATDVLEEGIDVSACSVVVSYDKPPNLKSFVQRRGRARRRHSTYAMVLSTEDDVSSLEKWHIVEKAMEKAYQEDRSRLEELRALETINEDVHAQFIVESTEAILTADNAMQHLYHFCSTLPSQKRVRTKPEFSFQRHEDGVLKGKVTLPSCVVPSARCAEGKRWWKTERAARKEAAFQAYKALYEHGLVNDNLLPLTKSQDFTKGDRRLSGAITEVLDQYDPWVDWAYAWMLPNVHKTRITVRLNEDEVYMNMFSPVAIPLLEALTLFWDSESTYTLEFRTSEPVPMTDESVESLKSITALYLQATSTGWLGGTRDYSTLFSPNLHPGEWTAWLNENQGYEPALKVFSSQRSVDRIGIVRDKSRYDGILLLNKWVNGNDGLEIECDPFPKRRNLLQRQGLATKRYDSDEKLESPTKRRIVPADQCTISRLPAKETVFGRFIATILNRLEAALVATKLCETILRDIHFNELRHVITAITTPAAEAPTNYQRYEFFGDTVLKFSVASFLYHQHPNWHEHYLSEGLRAIVENPRLAREAVDRDLGSFIISKGFNARKWSAPLISEKINTSRGRRDMSTKVLADVVEALIGAAYIDGGLAKAQACISRFLPEVQLPVPRPDSGPMSQGQDHQPHLIQQDTLEENIGYTFNDKSLLMEALTHGSCQHDASTQSYQRLEFLGDAVLDMLIVDTILMHPIELPQGRMTKIKATVVNASLLAFLCMEFSWPMPIRRPTTVPEAEVEMEPIEHASETLHLYSYLRHSPGTPLITNNSNSGSSSNTALTRYITLRPAILHSLATSRTYPRELLSALNPDKFFSDIIESIIGAIFVDSGRDLTPCREFIHRLGLVQYLERILDENIDVEHPIQKAQMGLQKLASKAGSPWKFNYHTVRVSGLGSEREHNRVYNKVVDGDVVVDVNADADATTDGRNGDLDPSDPSSSSSSDADSDSDPDADPSAGPTYTCTIPMHGLGFDVEEVVVTGCLSREEAEVRAACVTIELLMQKGVIVEADDEVGDREELEQPEVA